MPHKPEKLPRKLPLTSWRPGKRLQVSLPFDVSELIVSMAKESGHTPTGLTSHLIRLAAGGRTKPELPVDDTTKEVSSEDQG